MAYVEAQSIVWPEGQPAEETAASILQGAGQIIACLDANRIGNLRELLETTGVPHLCMFKGNLAEEAAEAAPWLVKLRPGDKLLRMLLSGSAPGRENPFAFRSSEAGIFIETDMTMPDLQRHLRRFLRVATPDGRNFLFRYWEPSVAATYFEGLNDRPDLILRWFLSREGGKIMRILAPLGKADAPLIKMIQPMDLPQTAQPAITGTFKLSEGDVWRFQQVRLNRDIARIAERLAKTFPDAVRKLDGITIGDFARHDVSRMMQFGFSRQSYLFTLLAWDLHYGPRFEHRDPQGMLTQILTASDPQSERFEKLKTRMAQIG